MIASFWKQCFVERGMFNLKILHHSLHVPFILYINVGLFILRVPIILRNMIGDHSMGIMSFERPGFKLALLAAPFNDVNVDV